MLVCLCYKTQEIVVSLFKVIDNLWTLTQDSFAFQVLYDNLEAKNAENENKIKELSKELRKKTSLVEVCLMEVDEFCS